MGLTVCAQDPSQPFFLVNMLFQNFAIEMQVCRTTHELEVVQLYPYRLLCFSREMFQVLYFINLCVKKSSGGGGFLLAVIALQHK